MTKRKLKKNSMESKKIYFLYSCLHSLIIFYVKNMNADISQEVQSLKNEFKQIQKPVTRKNLGGELEYFLKPIVSRNFL